MTQKTAHYPVSRILQTHNKPEEYDFSSDPPLNAVFGRRPTEPAVAISDRDRETIPRQVVFPKKSTKTEAKPDAKPKKVGVKSAKPSKVRTKTPTSTRTSQSNSKKQTPHKIQPKVQPSGLNQRGVSGKSADKITSSEMRKYIEEIPRILERKEDRLSVIAEPKNPISSHAIKESIRRQREIREKTKEEESKLRAEIQKRKEEIARNNKRIREINKERFRKRSVNAEFHIVVEEKKEGKLRQKSTGRARGSPDYTKGKRRSLSEDDRKTEGKLAGRRPRVGREGRRMPQWSEKLAEERRAEQAEAKSRERSTECKKPKKKHESSIRKRGKRQKRTKSSEVLLSDDHDLVDFLSRLPFSSPNLLDHAPAAKPQPTKFSPKFPLPDNQASIKEALMEDFPQSPPLSSTPSMSHRNPLLEAGGSHSDMITADFPRKEQQQEDLNVRKNELKRRLMELRTRVEEVQEAASDRNSHKSNQLDSSSAVSVVKAKDLQNIIRTEAAVKIQSNIRRFLAQRRVEGMVEEIEMDEEHDGERSVDDELVSPAEPVLGRYRPVDASPEQLFSRPKSCNPSSVSQSLHQFEAKLRAEQQVKEAEIARLRQANQQLTLERFKKEFLSPSGFPPTATPAPEDCLKLLVTAKEQELLQFQELMQTKCGSRVDLIEEMSMAFESMLEARYRQLLLLFSQNREQLQTALKTGPSELDISSTFTSGQKREETRQSEDEKQAETNPADLSLDAFLRRALGTVETDQIEAAAAKRNADLLKEAEKQAEIDFSSFDPSQPKPQHPVSDNSEAEDVASPDLSAIPLIVDMDDEESFAQGKRCAMENEGSFGGEYEERDRVASPEPDSFVDSGTSHVPFRVDIIVTKRIDEPGKPFIPFPTDSHEDLESSSDLEELLSRPAYVPLKPPQKPAPPKPKKAYSDGQSTSELLQHSFAATESRAEAKPTAAAAPTAIKSLDFNPFEASLEDGLSSLLSVSATDTAAPNSHLPPSETLIAEITESIIATLIRESFPAQAKPASESIPRLDFHHITPERSPRNPPLHRFTSCQIRDFVSALFQRVSEEQLHTVLTTPMCLDPVEVLGQLQDVEIGPLISGDVGRHRVIPADVLAGMEDYADDSSSRGDLTPTTNDIIRDSQRYHRRLLFDCINESLSQHRTYAKHFAPLPWSLRSRAMQPAVPGKKELETNVGKEVLKWAKFEVGKIPEGKYLLSSGVVDEDHLQIVREEKLSKMLTSDIFEGDELWIDYEPEETQVKIDLADMVLEELLDEVETILKRLPKS